MKRIISFPFPVFITVEGKWFVADCPILGIATQGRTEKEVKENIRDLIKEYLADPHTPKNHLKQMHSASLNYIPVPVSQEILHGKT